MNLWVGMELLIIAAAVFGILGFFAGAGALVLAILAYVKAAKLESLEKSFDAVQEPIPPSQAEDVALLEKISEKYNIPNIYETLV